MDKARQIESVLEKSAAEGCRGEESDGVGRMAAKVRMKTEKMGAFYIFKQHGSEEGNKGTPARAAVGVATAKVIGGSPCGKLL